MKGLQDFLRPHIGELNLEFTIQNGSPGRKATLEERLEHIESELGASLYRELLERNALDMLLYREAQQLFAMIRGRQQASTQPSGTPKSAWGRILQRIQPSR